MDFIAQQILPYLPPDLQALYLNPPNLSNPASFWPLIRSILPYTKWIIVILACYIVWSVFAGILGYFSRFVRFGLRIGPVIGLIALIMSNSGQGTMEELVDMAKGWVGLSSNTRGTRSPGIESLAGLFEGNKKKGRKATTPKTRASKTGDPDFVSSLLKSAAGYMGESEDSSWIQNYVKDTIVKASGLDWLFKDQAEQKKATR